MQDTRSITAGPWHSVRRWWHRRSGWAGALEMLDTLARSPSRPLPHAARRATLLEALCRAVGVPGAAAYGRLAPTEPWSLLAVHGDLRALPSMPPDALTPTPGEAGPALLPAEAVCRADGGTPASWSACSVAPQATALIALGRSADGRRFSAVDALVAAAAVAHLELLERTTSLAAALEHRDADLHRLEAQLTAEALVTLEVIHTVDGFPDIIGKSTALHRALHMVETVASSASSILITGETGTGKELIARAIHDRSTRRDGPLVSVNCPAIPHHLAESELFGHERGAFTDAVEARPGKFELADGGTLFLDEVAELPLPLQVKLLRVLQEREIQRLGARKTRRLDIRIVAATNRDLRAEMPHAFREDLYYRLATVIIELPPLRERVEDIPALATHFVEGAAAAARKTIQGFTGRALAMLRSYHWPGNVRELRNVVDRAVLLCGGDTIRPEHLTGFDAHGADSHRLSHIVRDEKVRRVRDALRQTGGNQAAAARLLGMSRSNFGRLLKSLGLKGTAGEDGGMREVG